MGPLSAADTRGRVRFHSPLFARRLKAPRVNDRAMQFLVIPQHERPPQTEVQSGVTGFLARDRWNDWGEYQTQFMLYVVDHFGRVHDVGNVKIGQSNLAKAPGSVECARPLMEDRFDRLPDDFFSLGQDANYYETLLTLEESLRDDVTASLRDVAADALLLERVSAEYVFSQSLSRDLTSETIKRFSRIIQGHTELTKFSFRYSFLREGAKQNDLDFLVDPASLPPRNVHVLIGQNGVGKTRSLRRMSRAIVLGEDDPAEGAFATDPNAGEVFGKVVTVAFSAFDPFGPLEETKEHPFRVGYEYIGLKRHAENGTSEGGSNQRSDEEQSPIKTANELRGEFMRSATACLSGLRRRRWRDALQTLSSDPIFEANGIVGLADLEGGSAGSHAATNRTFKDLSSGHKIVLLTVTRLVELVDEKTLVLIDEPESHLHPPLLAAFVRCLSDLLASRNGVGLIATHSPVVLQEVPRSCAWVISRSGDRVSAHRPSIETFGENVGVLTREVFALEVTRSGFHRLLEEAVKKYDGDYESVLSSFDNHLGSEARAIALSLCADGQSVANDAES